MVFFDFDGTLVDLWPRFNAVFCDICGVKIPLHEYRTVKKNLIYDQDVASHFGFDLPENYFLLKKELLEDKTYLELDKLVVDQGTVNSLFTKADAILLTKRRNKENLLWQINKLGLDIQVELINEGSKKEWVENHFPNSKCLIFGDSVIDLAVAKIDFCKAVMVDYGLGTKDQFDKENIPYQMIRGKENVGYEFMRVINKWNSEI